MSFPPGCVGFCQKCRTYQGYPGNCLHGCGPVVNVEYMGTKPSKYRAQPAVVDGVTFASKREANRWLQLKMLQDSGKISGLRRQVPFELQALGGQVVCRYIADSTYLEDGALVVEDAKGFRTPLYRLKKKWLKLQYGIEVRET